jgi:NarL family two-component system response regulator LiaR
VGAPITVATGHFEDLVAIGLDRLVSDDPSLRLVARDVEWERLEDVLGEHGPAVVVLNFGSLPSIAALRALLRTHADTRVVVLANRPSGTECNQLLAFGVSACMSKETQGRDVIHSIHLASRGMHLAPRASILGSTPEFPELAGPDLLTAREGDVLELLQKGRTNAQIAQELTIGMETVRTHARNIYRKLGISSRRELALLAR